MNLLSDITTLMPVEPQTLEVVLERTKNRMKAYIITMVNDHDSTVAARRVLQSIYSTESQLDPFIYPAVTPATLEQKMKSLFGQALLPNIRWTYPTKEEENRYDLRTGLQLSFYPTKNIQKRIACTLSHYSLWLECYKNNEPIMILEHDALFTRKFEYNRIETRFTGDILGLNDPIGATRKASKFHFKLKTTFDERWSGKPKTPYAEVYEAPWIDNNIIPQGIAGNSAYIIKPEGAAELIKLTAENGLWPNDAIMCKQLMPGKLQVCYPYITKVQGLKSTTSE